MPAMALLRPLLLAAALVPQCSGPEERAPDYDRAHFYSGWTDPDGDCVDLRHELLERTAVRVTQRSADGCRVVRGVWIDPYTGERIREAGLIEIDHVVPLRWAWEHGADEWTPERRREFALDEAFLIPVSASANRSKGARGAIEWLPEDPGARCAYVARFRRGVAVWELELSEIEEAAFRTIQMLACEGRGTS